MMRFRYACAAVRPALSALLALSGCATHTTPVPVVPTQPPRPAATTPIEPCVFRGSLLTSATLYLEATGEQAIAWLDEHGAVQIDRLELSSTPGGRAKVVVRFPIQMEAYIDENKDVMRIDKRVDVVPGHVWLDPGTAVHASLLSGGTAEIRMQFPDGTTPPELVTPLPCTDLSLPQGKRLDAPTPTGDPVYLRPVRISIHESAGGREIAAIDGPSGWRTVWVRVWLLEKKPGWLRVDGHAEFHFDGWIPVTSVFPPGDESGQYGIIGLIGKRKKEVTHEVTRPIPLRIKATDAAPVIASAAKGAEILIAPGPPGYRVIRFEGVSAMQAAPFVARDADLIGAVRLADGVEPGAPESPDPEDTWSAPAATPSTPIPPPAPILPPSIEKIWDIAEVPVHASLEEGTRRFRKGDWAGASKALSTALKGLSDGDFEARIIGHALLGRACDRKGDDTCAANAYTKVLELAKSSEAKVKEIVALGGDDNGTKLEARLLLAQGEALFYKAEQKREAADAVQFPIYRGSGDRADILNHITTKIMDWIEKKRPLVEEADQAYTEILALQPAPPPAWVVLAAGRRGDMWSAFVYEFQTLPPIPSEWNGTGNVPGTDLSYEELRREYRGKLVESSEPQRQLAAKAYKSCSDHAKKHGVSAAEGKRCEERLAAMGATP